MSNEVLIIIDYFLQYVEAGETKQEARDRALKFMQAFKDNLSDDTYSKTQDIINRLAAI